MRSAADIRQIFLDFFEQRAGHTVVPSSAVVPHDDPTLLFTNAGMNQFKDVFLGRGTRPYQRAVDTQKCIRAGGKHNDLEDVGRDTYHHTFFEMLGNWSFGDYFKAEAIEWAWELLTSIYGLPADRLYATYFAGDSKAGLDPDTEARALWRRVLPAERVLPGLMRDNFWEMGESGPCGPCSEIHFDRIGGRDAADRVNKGDPDVLEIWNLVFIQFNREVDGTLRPLPARHVDTGMGFERLTSVLQGKRSNYDTDLWTPIFARIREVTGARAYDGNVEKLSDPIDVAYRVIADHARCLTAAIADGAAPGNEGRNYVLRRILRRAVRMGHQTLGVREPFLWQMAPAVAESLGGVFPEMREKLPRVQEIIREEESAFGRTLERGLALFNEAAGRSREATLASGGDGSGTVAVAPPRIAAEDAFRLHDTFGFPIDLTRVMAEERGLEVDLAGYEALMERAKQTSRDAAEGAGDQMQLLTPDAIAGLAHMGVHPTNDSEKYPGHDVRTEVAAIWNGRNFDEHADVGTRVAIIFHKTSCYSESGGQIGDRGTFIVSRRHGDDSGRDQRFEVDETRALGGFVLHIGHVASGQVRRGDNGLLSVERGRRQLIRGHHTGTHLLNHALRSVLGDEVQQRGSLVADDRLRFDFSFHRSVKIDELARIEELVNDAIAADSRVHAAIVPLDEAKRIRGVRAVFGERYPDPVRVVSVGVTVEELIRHPDDARWIDHSIEFCGGTHLATTSEAMRLVILSESAVSAGVRRITALAGAPAQAAVATAANLAERLEGAKKLDGQALAEEVDEIGEMLKDLPTGVLARQRLEPLLVAQRERVKAWRKESEGANLGQIVERAREIAAMGGGKAIVARIDGAGRDPLLAALDAIRAKRTQSAVLLISADHAAGRVTIVAHVPPPLVEAGLKAGDWVRVAAQACGGSGGGRPDSAQAGGKDPGRAGEALAAAQAHAAKFTA
ncbi:MAG: alanine--tRNA ligase [Phycisphaeraceae bacterium]|nr:alanine--tRNA ligase [Phycisphaeraceae bacterium]